MANRRLLNSDDDEGDYIYGWDDDSKWERKQSDFRSHWKKIVCAGVMVAVLLTILLVVFLPGRLAGLNPPDPDTPRPPSNAPLFSYREAVVTANGYLCAPIGRDIMSEGGNAIDAVIGTLLCEGAMNIQSMGVGGGFLLTLYNRKTGLAVALNARESAPAAAHKDMFNGNSSLSQRGGLSVAVPGELRGYQELYDKYGSGLIAWERLFLPTIALCRDGFKVSSYLANILKNSEPAILANSGLREFLVNEKTGHVLQEGDLLRQVKLAKTLEIISKGNKAEELYNGTLTDTLVSDIQRAGGIVTRQDMEQYSVQWQQPINATVWNHTMYSVPLPGSGVILAFILNILDKLLPEKNEILSTHRIIEAFKFGYGRRTELGDFTDPSYVPDAVELKQLVHNLTSPHYANDIRKLISDTMTHSDPTYYGAVLAQLEDHGTAHVNVIDRDGNAVSVTSTINLILGSQLVSESTGIILNDEMDDFSAPNITNAFGLPPSPANFIYPGKRPLSSMCPAIFVNDAGEAILVTGAAGGSKITTATALVAIRALAEGKTIKQALDEPRFHHQLFPMSVDYEFGLTKDVVEGLEKIGHITSRSMSAGSTVTSAKRDRSNVTGCYDFRRGGSVDGF